MAVNSYKPNEALQELRYQEQIINLAIDTQVILQLLVKHNIITRKEVADMRKMVREHDDVIRITIEDIERKKKAFKLAKENPQEYLKAMFQAKLDGKL